VLRELIYETHFLDILSYFQNIINKDRKLSEAVAAIMTLLKYIELSSGKYSKLGWVKREVI
jgi:hypothetical protein